MYKEADKLLEILRKSFTTVDTTEANTQRIAQYRGLRDNIKSYLLSLDANVKAAAVKLYDVVGKYNNIILKGGTSAATAAIDNLLQDLSAAEGGIDLSQEVQTIGATTWVNNLRTTNETYKQALAERSEESTDRPDAGRMKQVRAEMDQYYSAMINIVDARLLVIGNLPDEEEEEEQPSGPVEDRSLPDTEDGKIVYFAKRLNFHITHYKSILKGRQTRSGKKIENE
jgi:hypothetical protein